MPGAQNRAVPRSQGQKRWIFATESVECVEDAGDHPEQTRTGAANWDRLGSTECPKWSRALARRCHTLSPLSCKTALQSQIGRKPRRIRTARKSANRPSFYGLPMESTIRPVGETRGHGFTGCGKTPNEWRKGKNWGMENYQSSLVDRSWGILAQSIFRAF